MNRSAFKTAVWMAWTLLPITALNYWYCWDRLPAKMAVHFDANWQPNGFTTRQGSLWFSLGLISFMLVVCTAVSYLVLALKQRAAWPVLVTLYLALGFCLYGSNAIVEYNLRRNQSVSRSAAPLTHSLKI